jgi:DNA polymerase-1
MFENVPDNPTKLILVDGSSYLFRAFHALPNLTNSSGEHTGAILGVINMLKRIPSQLGTNHVVVVFDAKGKNFRHDLYPEYKANRKAMADELREQIEPIHDIIKAMGFPLVCVPKVEADDVIGTLSRQAEREGWEVIISSGDKDMAQLVSKHITLMDTMKNSVTDINAVQERYGITPEQFIDFLALVGDTSDNIPGVPKVGPKTATKWLNEYGNIKGVIDNAEKIKGKVGENLQNSIDQIPLSYELATIKIDLDLDFDLEQCLMCKPNYPTLIENFTRYELKGLLKEIEYNHKIENNHKLSATKEKSYECILEENQLDNWVDKLKKSKYFAIDTETTSLNAMDAELVGISLAVEVDHAAYIPISHQYENAPNQLDMSLVFKKLLPILDDESIAKIGHNLKYDLKVLEKYNISLKGQLYDTMLESYIHNSSASRHDLDSLCVKYFNHSNISYESVAGKGKSQINFSQVTIDNATPYAAEDADMTLKLHEYFWPRIKETSLLEKLFLSEEVPTMLVLKDMELTGVKIDTKQLEEQSKYLETCIKDFEQKAYAIAGEEFNLSSPKQLAEILFDKLNIPAIKKTPTGKPSTSVDVMSELSLQYELPKIILDHRHFSKLKSTYTDKLPLMINAKTDRVHTSYQQAVAITGRLSSTDPNLQNIPIRSEEGKRIRKAFISEKGYTIIAADYSQVELRIMAHLSGDQTLIDAFNSNKDIHSATAAELAGISLEEVSSEQRRRAKAVNFGLIYGMSAFGLAKQLGVSREEAQNYVNIYFERYPGVKKYMENTRIQASESGYVETIFGRRLYLPDIKAKNMGLRKAAERAAINAPMQGTAADIIKRAMVTVAAKIKTDELPIKMIMQVHDELIFEVKESYIDEAKKLIVNLMEGAAELSVPLIVDVGTGSSWADAH